MNPLALLRSLGISLRADGGKLLGSPREEVTADVRDYVRLHRTELLALLASEEADDQHRVSKEIWP